ncbi:MAG: hypothetical protein LBS68_01725 [Puniceicoccales bacterium]|jgi:ADP-heptose:LPS heptosyltransferase/lauroyl/myristoyl acyltransferase|nr:hypothetical protein [Puniceicoccales bacterium]
MAKFFLTVIGFLIFLLPRWFLCSFCHCLGAVFFYGVPRRRRSMLNNLLHVYPNLDGKELRSIARKSADRLIEMGLFALASPRFSPRYILRQFSLRGPWEEVFRCDRPQLILVPHQTLTEALTFVPLFLRIPREELRVGVLYRPFDGMGLEKFVKKTRERFGIRLLSRKDGLVTSANFLRHNGCVGLLFDQHAGASGVQTFLCGKVTSTTQLPEILLKHSGAQVSVASVERTAFWKGTLVIEPFPVTAETVGGAMDSWLEEQLLGSKNFRDNWLWAHNRWKRPINQLLNLGARKNRLPGALRRDRSGDLPRKTEFYVRMPNRLGETILALPILRALHAGRPDARITALCPIPHAKWLTSLPFIDGALPLPEGKFGYFRHMRKNFRKFPDLHLLFTDSLRGDLEAFFLGATVRIGFSRNHFHRRPLLTHRLPLERAPTLHWTEVRHRALKKLGLSEELSLEPLLEPRSQALPRRIGLLFNSRQSRKIFGSEERWNFLIQRLLEWDPEVHILLCGVREDAAAAEKILKNFPLDRVSNGTSRSSLPALAEELHGCGAAVVADFDGLHLANALGVPAVALPGLVNSPSNDPIFSSPKVIFRPPALDAPMEKITAEAVFTALQDLLEKTPS